jgi:hypothetical protein
MKLTTRIKLGLHTLRWAICEVIAATIIALLE